MCCLWCSVSVFGHYQICFPWCHLSKFASQHIIWMQTRICFKCLHPFFHCLRICEICGSTACNVAGFCDAEFIEQWNESSNTASAQATATEPRRFWQGHRFLNFLLACMVFAFVISWLFHFNVPGWVLLVQIVLNKSSKTTEEAWGSFRIQTGWAWENNWRWTRVALVKWRVVLILQGGRGKLAIL